MSTCKSFIYGLIDPITGQLRYVGKTTCGNKRIRDHRAQLDGTPKANWIAQLLRCGLRPDVIVLEHCDGALALNEAEQHHIGYFRAIGCLLLNQTGGGDGRSTRTRTVRGVFAREVQL